MSYILDALKKSEASRSELNTFSSAPAPALPQQQTATHRFALPLLLALGALMSGWLIAQRDKPAQEITTTPVAVIPARSAPVVAVPLASTAAPDKPVIRHHSESEPVNQSGSASAAKTSAPAGEAGIQSRDVAAETPPVATANMEARSLGDMPVSFQQSLPAIKIEGHIYDDNPDARMVIINGEIRREKQAVGNGLRLEEITSDGVILSYQGTLFHMGIFARHGK